MSTSEIRNILHTKFTRTTKIDYKTENRAVCIWFGQWDTDKSGDFNDTEWEKYQDDVRKAEKRQAELKRVSINKDLLSTYDEMLISIDEQCNALAEKFKAIDNSSWEKLLEFEEKHPAINRAGLYNKEAVPEGAYEFDISALQVGIYDAENDCFTGECYDRGYVTGLDELDEDERNEYLQLLELSIDNSNELKHYIDEATRLDQEFDKYCALKDMAETGVINELISQDDETKLYSQYVNIRSNTNPFYNEIKDIEQKMTTLRLKGTKTDDDLRQIEQYRIQLNQLYEASRQWKLSDCDKRPSLNEEISEEMPSQPKLQVTDLSGSISYQDGSASQETSVGVAWNPNESIHVNANASNTASFSAEDKKFTDEINANLEAGYNHGGFSITSTTNVNHSSEMTTYVQGVNTSYKNVSANVTETVMSMEKGNVDSTNASLSWNAGKYTTTGSAELTESGNTYNIETKGDYKLLQKGLLKDEDSVAQTEKSYAELIKLTPKLGGSYNDKTKDWMLAPTIELYAGIKRGDFIAEFRAMESHVTTFGKEAITTNHNFTATGNLEVKKWSFGTEFNDSDTPNSHSNTYGVNTSYSIDNVGTISAEASHQVSRTKDSGKRNNSTMFTISFKAPLETIGKLFGLE